LFPGVIIFIIVIIVSSLVTEWFITSDNYIWKPRLTLSSTAVAALSGAYMWVVNDFISRSRRQDFSPSDILSGALRLVIAAAIGLSFGSIVKDDLGAFVAFALGAFPLGTIQVVLRQLSYRQLGLELGPIETNDLLRLDGIDRPLAERLANEDITSVAQLAYCDPIHLTMSSNLTFNAVVDLVSQALAWVYIGDKLTSIRPLGFRGAYEVRTLLDCLLDEDLDDPKNKDAAEKVLPILANTLGLTVDGAQFLLREIAFDPYTDFIYSTWAASQGGQY
jgi:hypothetical protein